MNGVALDFQQPIGPRNSRRLCLRQCTVGFTVVELIVCLGIAMILAGLALPSLASIRRQAKATAWLATVQQNSHLVDMYTSQSREVFPQSGVSRVGDAARDWWRALEAMGLLEASGDTPTPDRTAVRISACFVYDAALMRPGLSDTKSLWDRSPRPVRRSDVLNPTLKGMIWMPSVDPTRAEPERNAWCCLGDSPPGPIGYADGSAVLASWRDLVTDGSMYVEHDIGYVVISTWDGVRGIDKRRKE